MDNSVSELGTVTDKMDTREGIARELCKASGGVLGLLIYDNYWLKKADVIIDYLKSQGVIKKVDYYVSGTEVNCPNCHASFLGKFEEL